MKKLTLFLFLLQSTIALAQAPQKMSYQSVVRNVANQIVANQNIGVKISIVEGSITGTIVYSETHTTTTNINGLFTLEAGGGTSTTGTFAAINWSNGAHYIKSEIDVTGGTNYALSGTMELLSVPYALFAKTAGNSIPGPQGIQGVTGQQGTTGNNGTNGADGKTILNGVSNPTSLIGSNGDFYLNTTTKTIFGPKNSGSWPTAGISLIGPTGPQGPPGSASGAFQHWIGQEFGGGIVFYVFRDLSGIEHGLIVSKYEAGYSTNWGVNSYLSDATSLFDGMTNTIAIMNAGAAVGSAAEICYNYNSEGYDDWYLPAQSELEALFSNEYAVNRSLYLTGGNLLNTDQQTYQGYYSSTQASDSRAFVYSVYYGNCHGTIPKDWVYSTQVRAIRSF